MKNYRYDGKTGFDVHDFDCGDTGEFKDRHEAIGEFTRNLEKINEYQQKLFAEQKEGIIFVFQAMDAAGKDGAVRAVLSCLSPQGVSEHSFKVPSSEENRHDYLWRFWKALPEKGSISIFNRSYYEDVLVQKIHKIYENNNYADRIDRDEIIDNRYEQICAFEKYLWENSIRVVKIFLNVSKEEQARRFISRIDTPKKNWKFSSGDIDERAYWDEYMEAYETCINRTAKKDAPWYVVPADHKWYARLVISRIVLNELKNMDPKWPVLPDDEMEKLQGYRSLLAKEIGDEPDDEKEKDEGDKPKPSDTAVGIALKNDRLALSEKKFDKLLKKSIEENFSSRFSVSAQSQEQLCNVYFDIEEKEANAEADDLEKTEALYRSGKDELKAELAGCGKEGKKLYKRYKKSSKEQITLFEEKTNTSYEQFEEELKQYMAEYELSVRNGGVSDENALAVYTEKVRAAFDSHRISASVYREETEKALKEIFDEYVEISAAFHPEKATDIYDFETNEEIRESDEVTSVQETVSETEASCTEQKQAQDVTADE